MAQCGESKLSARQDESDSEPRKREKLGARRNSPESVAVVVGDGFIQGHAESISVGKVNASWPSRDRQRRDLLESQFAIFSLFEHFRQQPDEV